MGSNSWINSSINLWNLQNMDGIEEILDFIDEGLIEINSINLKPSLLEDENDNTIYCEDNNQQ